jgi:hypothetical protein
MALSIFTAKKEKEPTNNPLQELNQLMADLQTRQAEAQRLLTAATAELMPLLTTQRKVDQERPRLVQSRQSAQYAVQEAEQALARAIGKPDEAAYIEQLEQAEQALSEATQALATCDTQFDRERTQARILALRETIQGNEQLHRELTRSFEKAREERKNLALVEMYRAYEKVFQMFEYGGPALYELRNDDPQAFDQLFLDLRIDEWQISELLVQQFNLDTPDYRPELRMRQLAIRERLAQLGKK